MANPTEHEFRYITSGRRALVAAYVRERHPLLPEYCFAWADAYAALVESGWSTAARALLEWVLDPAKADDAARTLLGGMQPADLSHELRRVMYDLRPVADLLPWATIGMHLDGEYTYARPTLDLDDDETPDARQWPPVNVAVYQSGTDPLCVLVEVGPAGPPTPFTPDQARRPVHSAPGRRSDRGGRPMTEEDYIRELARRVRLHRLYRELTQQQLADRTGLSRSFVSVFETGDHGIQVISLRRVAAGLGLRFSALVDDPADQGAPLFVPTTTGGGR